MITKQTPDDFKTFLKKWKEWGDLEGSTVRLNSPGGSLIACIQLGELFRNGKFSTEVGSTSTSTEKRFGNLPLVSTKIPGVCMSACAHAFLGGVNRTAKAGEVGFHQLYSAPPADGAPAPSAADSASEVQAVTTALTEYLKEMDVDPEVLSLASVTPSANLTTPDGMLPSHLTASVTQVALVGHEHIDVAVGTATGPPPRTLGQFDRCKPSRSAPNLPPAWLIWPSIWGISDYQSVDYDNYRYVTKAWNRKS